PLVLAWLTTVRLAGLGPARDGRPSSRLANRPAGPAGHLMMTTPAREILNPAPVSVFPQVTPERSLRQTNRPRRSFWPYGSTAKRCPSYFTDGKPESRH